MIQDEWINFEDIRKQLVSEFYPIDTNFRIMERRESVIEFFSIHPFAIPTNKVNGFLKKPTFQEEQKFEDHRKHIKLLHRQNARFLNQTLCKMFSLTFTKGICRNPSGTTIAHHYQASHAWDEYIEIDKTHLKDFLHDIDYALLICMTINRYSERQIEEFDFSDLVNRETTETCTYEISVAPSRSHHPRMKTESRLFGKTIVSL